MDYEPIGLDYPAYLGAGDLSSYPDTVDEEQEQTLEPLLYENFLIDDAIESPAEAPPLGEGGNNNASPSKEPEIR